jgi:hypothetical protein
MSLHGERDEWSRRKGERDLAAVAATQSATWRWRQRWRGKNLGSVIFRA